MIQRFCCSKSSFRSLQAVHCWLARAEALWAISAQLRRQSSCFLPQLILPCLASLFLTCFAVPELLCSRILTSASKPVECYSYTLLGASKDHHLQGGAKQVYSCKYVKHRVYSFSLGTTVSLLLPHPLLCLCHVLCPGQGPLCPYSGGCKSLVFSILQKSRCGAHKGDETCPESHFGEHSSWHIHLSSKPKVPLLYPTAWLSATASIKRIHDLSSFAFKLVRSQVANTGAQAKSGPPPCFIWPSTLFLPAAAPSSLPLVKEQLHLYSPKITFGPLKVTVRLMWPPVKMNLTPLCQVLFEQLSSGLILFLR